MSLVMDYDMLFYASDLSQEQYTQLKEQCQDRTIALTRCLLSHSTWPELRNLCPPPGEIYAPVYYCPDYMIKLVKKESWGGYLLTIVLWDLLVIDIDRPQPKTGAGGAEVSELEASESEGNEIDRIKANIATYYPNELFYLHQTCRGYHLYLVSRRSNHLSKHSIYARIKLEADPAHGTNSLYTGNSIRISRKNKDPADVPISQYVCSVGSGHADPSALAIYQQVQHYLSIFSGLQIDPTNPEHYGLMYKIWAETKAQHQDFGLTHVVCSAPMTLGEHGLVTNPSFCERSPSFDSMLQHYWSTFIKYRNIKESQIPYLLLMCQHNMGFNNLYRIFEASPDYAIGVHLQQNVHFISYYDLLMVDYDSPRLAIVYRYCKSHPEATFRIVQSNKGYHCFLTSYPVPHQYCILMLLELRADPCHLVGAYHRGYSVRINKKYKKEKPYREICRYGKAPEDPRLVALYQKHLDLYHDNRAKYVRCQSKDAEDILAERAGHSHHLS